MGLSTGRDLHVDTFLSEVALNYRPTGMIADQIAPIVSVSKETNAYPIFSRAEAFAIEDTIRSRQAEARRVTRSVSSGTYACKNYALAYDVPIEDRANMDAALQIELEAGAVRYLEDKLMLDWDRRVMTTLTTTANVGTVFLTGSSWTAGGDPVSQIWRMMEQVQNTTALKPNSIIMGWRAWNLFRRNSNARNYINGVNNGGGAVTRTQAAAAFEVERFLVAGAFYNTANEAQAASLTANALADACMVYYAPMAASRETPSFMYSFRWAAPELGTPMAVIRHPFDTRKRIEGIELQYYQDERVTGYDYAALLASVGSSQANGLT